MGYLQEPSGSRLCARDKICDNFKLQTDWTEDILMRSNFHLHISSGSPSPESMAVTIPEITSSRLGLFLNMKRLAGRFFGNTRSLLPGRVRVKMSQMIYQSKARKQRMRVVSHTHQCRKWQRKSSSQPRECRIYEENIPPGLFIWCANHNTERVWRMWWNQISNMVEPCCLPGSRQDQIILILFFPRYEIIRESVGVMPIPEWESLVVSCVLASM